MLTSDQIQSLYIAYFNRPADLTGLTYWVNQVNNGACTIDDVANAFSHTPEYNSLYGGFQNAAALVDAMYQNIFGHVPDALGKDYWVTQVRTGSVLSGNLAQTLLNAAQSTDMTVLNNKLQYANTFSVIAYQTGTYYSGDAATAVARGLLSQITADSATALQAISQIAMHLGDVNAASINPQAYTPNITNHIWNPPVPPVAAGPTDTTPPVISNFKPNGANTFTITSNEAGLVGLKDSLGHDVASTTSLLANSPTTVVVSPQGSVLSDVQVYVKDNAGNMTNATTKLALGTDSSDYINHSSNTAGEFIYGFAGNDTITGGSGNDTIAGGAGADMINGGAASDTYLYAAASESTIINVASPAAGFDTVTITSGDVFDFALDVTAVRTDQYYVGQVPQANGDALLAQLNSYYQSAGPAAGIDAMYISIGNNAKGRFLVIDIDGNNLITSNDLIIEIVGITNNKDIQLGLVGGNVVMNEVDPPLFP